MTLPPNIKPFHIYDKETHTYIKAIDVNARLFYDHGSSYFCLATFLGHIVRLGYGAKVVSNTLVLLAKTKKVKAQRFSHVTVSDLALKEILKHKEEMKKHNFHFFHKFRHNIFMQYQGFSWKVDPDLKGSVIRFNYKQFETPQDVSATFNPSYT